jgi:hypothetical protein
MNDKGILEAFDTYGRAASFHYADDTGKEWGTARIEERKARNLFADNPDLRDEMTKLASQFLWSL